MVALLGDADRACQSVAAGVPDAVVGDELEPLRQSGLGHQLLEPIGEQRGVHENNRRSLTPEVVLQIDPGELCSLHRPMVAPAHLAGHRARMTDLHSRVTGRDRWLKDSRRRE